MNTEAPLSDAELDVEYDKHWREFRNAVADCQAVSSAAAGRMTDNRRWWACLLFTRLCTTALSLLKVLPESPLERPEPVEPGRLIGRHWDFTAVAVLGRTLFETQLTLFYLGLEDIDEDEWLSRLNLMQLHDYTTRRKVFADLTPADKSWDENRETVNDLTRKLNSRKYFSSLNAKDQRRFLTGGRVSFLGHEEILARMGETNVRAKMAFWRWWSSYVHSFPMSYYRMPDQMRGTGIENRTDKKYISGALTIVTEIVRFSCAGMRRIFPDVPSRDEFVGSAIRQIVHKRRNESSGE
jgi:Family of unknown function (DUF5677)